MSLESDFWRRVKRSSPPADFRDDDWAIHTEDRLPPVVEVVIQPLKGWVITWAISLGFVTGVIFARWVLPQLLGH